MEASQQAPKTQEVLFGWYPTAPNPRSPATGYDAGQRGWRLHAVLLNEGENYRDMKRRPALCGLWPRHGWGGDLFIEDECARCSAVMTKREASGDVFIDLPDRMSKERQALLLAQEADEENAGRAALKSASPIGAPSR
ncbi:hypothetical protein [Variovorax sp.]|uniref:hypothetical protein n=1 Tax=Variovorax sp. TaxID=1871043 RepID=UPI004037AD71